MLVLGNCDYFAESFFSTTSFSNCFKDIKRQADQNIVLLNQRFSLKSERNCALIQKMTHDYNA